MFDAIEKWWTELMAVPGANWVVAIFLFICVLLVGFYFVKNCRDLAMGKIDSGESSHFTDFEKLRSEGKLDEDEYKRLKEALRRRR